jgi:hypothetical protein
MDNQILLDRMLITSGAQHDQGRTGTWLETGNSVAGKSQ